MTSRIIFKLLIIVFSNFFFQTKPNETLVSLLKKRDVQTEVLSQRQFEQTISRFHALSSGMWNLNLKAVEFECHNAEMSLSSAKTKINSVLD